MTARIVSFRNALFVAALATTALAPLQAIAQTTETPVRVRYDFASVGLVPGQTLRVSVAIPPDPCRATSTGELPPDPCRPAPLAPSMSSVPGSIGPARRERDACRSVWW